MELEFLQPCLTVRICIVALCFRILELEFVFEALVASLGHLEIMLAFAPVLQACAFGQSIVVELFNCRLLAGGLAGSCLTTHGGHTLATVGLSLEQSSITTTRLGDQQLGSRVHLGWL